MATATTANANAGLSRTARQYEAALIRWVIALRRLQMASAELLDLPADECPAEVMSPDPHSMSWFDLQREARGVRWCLDHAGTVIDSDMGARVRDRVNAVVEPLPWM